MHCVRVDRPAEWERCHLYPIGDLHLGDSRSDYRACVKLVEQIRLDPFAVCALNGDIMNTATRQSKSDIYAEICSPDQAIDDAVGLFTPIKDKIIGITTGNHELRIQAVDGIDTTRHLAQRLGLIDYYNPDGVLVFLRFGRTGGHNRHANRPAQQWYSIYMTHGRGGGKKMGAKANRLEDMADTIDADVLIHSHTHAPMTFPLSRWRVSPSTSSACEVESLCLNTGSTLGHGGYAQQNEYKPSSKQMPVGVLYAKEKRAIGITDYFMLQTTPA